MQIYSYYFGAQAQGFLVLPTLSSDKIEIKRTIKSITDVKTGSIKAGEKAHDYWISIGYSHSPHAYSNVKGGIT